MGGKFVIEASLGGGAMGAVYRARDESLEREVAIKVMHPTVATDPSYVRRFRREAQAASRLDHPNVMRVIEFGEEPDGLLYMAMEYLDGRDLHTVIEEDWPLSNARVVHVMTRALAALAAAHEKGVIHRDLKPENIMVLLRRDDEGQDIVKICDFGIAKLSEHDEPAEASSAVALRRAKTKLTTAGLLIGTPEYMSPEQARGEALDARSDVYSMGLILYHMLTGRPPFLADSALDVVIKQISEAPAAPHTLRPDVHEGLAAVSMKAIAKPRGERFQSAREMRAALKAVIEGRPIPADSEAVTGVDPLLGTQLVVRPDPLPPSGAIGAAESSREPTSSRTSSADVDKAMSLESDPPVARPRAWTLLAAILALGAAGALAIYVRRAPAIETSKPPPRSETSGSALANVVMSAPAFVEPTPATDAPSAAPPIRSSEPKRPIHARPIGAPPTGQAPPPPPPVLPSAPLRSDPPPIAELAPPPPPSSPPVVAALALASPPPPAAVDKKVFNSQTCRAQVGLARSVSTYSVRDLSTRGVDEVWTRCARSSIREASEGPMAAVVRVRFSDNARFVGATCTGCPGPLAACVASATRTAVSVHIMSGDATGDPEFDIPVTFTCE
jgi:serine/threonine-protein kinase